ncbi:MAG: fibronectin type III domain-containing protein [Candidatus Eremiobacteraeota bacterium]|nr:fibronectin type III domain-containing protein [Candidatus Eremiobacteraeota bacterium]MBV8366083.1 fibronectin type III domain-containing protein [Candidatus Eremiobacteraeota bacterium]
MKFLAVVALAFILGPATGRADVPSNVQAGNTHAVPTITNLNATRGGPNTIVLTWTMQGHDGYIIKEIVIHRRGPNKTENISLSPVQRWSDRNANPGIEYGYAVCAIDNGGERGCAVAKYALP